MKNLYLLFIALFISSANFSQDSIMPILHEKIPNEELNADLVFLKNKAIHKRYKYDGLMYAGKEQFYNLYDSIQKVIRSNESMSRLDFYFLTAPLIELLQDDVSIYSLVGKYAHDIKNEGYLPFAEKTVIPLEIEVFHDTVYITSHQKDLYKSRLISVNDIPASEVIAGILKYTSFSKNRYYQKYRCASLDLYYSSVISYVLFGFHDEVVIQYVPFGDEAVSTKSLKLLPIGDVSFYQHVRMKMDSLPWYSLSFKEKAAVLKIKTMPPDDLKIIVINDIFGRIHENNPASLVIDISGCSWSYDNFWIILLNYLYEGELSFYEFQKRPQDLSHYTKKRINNISYILGKFSDINKDFRFKGNIYLITGTSTSSAAVRFADIIKFNGIVSKTFGSETLTKASQYDFYNSHFLPATGISLGLSTTFYYALDKNLNTHGLIPDVEMKPKTGQDYLYNFENENEMIIDEVINLLKSEKSKNEDTPH